MSNLIKIIIIGVAIILISISAQNGIATFIANKNNIYCPVADAMVKESLVSPVLAVKSVASIPTEKTRVTPDNLSLKAAAAIDLSSREEIFAFNQTERWPLASLTKLMSAIVAIENMDANQKISFSNNAILTEGVVGRFAEGETFSVIDLVNAMMVTSSNDAAIALAEHMPDGQFVALMNSKADSLNMHNTRFSEPTGLSMLNQGTINDLSLLVEYAWDNHPELFSISSKPMITIREINSQRNRRLENINFFAPRNDFLGGKTGFTRDANQNFIAVFSLDRKPIAILILGADDRIQETKTIISFINDINRSY